MRFEVTARDYLLGGNDINHDNPIEKCICRELGDHYGREFDHAVMWSNAIDLDGGWSIRLYDSDDGLLDVNDWVERYCHMFENQPKLDAVWLEELCDAARTDDDLDAMRRVVGYRMRQGYDVPLDEGEIWDPDEQAIESDVAFLNLYRHRREFLPFRFNIDLRRIRKD